MDPRLLIEDPRIVESAYRQGVFPMGDPETGEVHWYRPEPRALIDLENFHVPRRLAKTLRSDKFTFTVDRRFEEVIRACARPEDPDGRWITEGVVQIYLELHRRGRAHSLEVWTRDDRLAGGLYGVAFGAAFMGESMFHHVRDASKAALVALVRRLRGRGFLLLDTQFATGHLAQFGLLMVSHEEYMRRLEPALERDAVRFTGPEDGVRFA